ncbi:ABC transporter permease [Frankia nepalensis]|uniref:ABC transporter permease n=1 Tax=Frankia nepalensis TaxID=1836974 RepID=UPI0027DC0B85|nr:ABC transporter permease [Frankia nepalensis]
MANEADEANEPVTNGTVTTGTAENGTAVVVPARDARAADPAALRPVRPTRRPPGRSGRLVRLVAPLATLAVVLFGWWYGSVRILDPDRRFLLPPPQDVARVGLLDGDNRAELLGGLWSTSKVALVGLALSIVIGVLFAIVMSQARWVEHSLYPYAVVLQTIPILAVVPLLGFWFGFEFRSRVIVCVLVAVFPIITNTLFGLRSVEPDLHDLFSLYGAGRVRRLVRLELPAALPAAITGCKISAGLAVIGSIIADFFFRQGDPGIGRLIDIYRQRVATEQLLTALFLSSLVGLVLFWGFEALGGFVQRRRSSRPH